ncbi:ATP-binding protein [Bacillus sp. 2205SS5-2]|uniref:ATP-binding protein n=1 Tax=Bacillus sp. 2205SS5-2 TaxID=3109031 RepID=UPI0030062E76
MRIKGFHIYGYGKINDLEVKDIQQFQLVYGENEAGKSSIQHFFHSVLFGFPTKVQNEPRYEPLHHTAYGGKVIFQSDIYGEIVIERKKGKATGDVSVYLENGTIGGEKELATILNGIEKETFQNIFSFDIHGLQNLSRLSDEEISRYLFSAAVNGTDEVFQLENRWEKEKNQLYRKSGKKPIINVLLNELKELEKELKIEKKKNGQYLELIKRKAEREASFSELKEMQNQMLKEKQELLSYQEKLPLYQERQQLQENLALLENAVNFPIDGLELLERYRQTAKTIAVKLQRNREKETSLQEEMSPYESQRHLLPYKQEIHSFIQQEESFRKLQQELEAVQRDLVVIHSSISQRINKLNLRFDEDELAKLETGILVKHEVKQLLQEHISLQSSYTHIQASYQREREGLRMAEQQCASVEALMLEEKEFNELLEQSHQVEKRKEIQKERMLLLQQESVVTTPLIWILLVSLVIFTGMTLGLMLNQTIITIVFLISGIALFSGYIYSRQKNNINVSKVQKRLEQLDQQIRDYPEKMDENLLQEQRQLRMEWKQKIIRSDEQQFRFKQVKNTQSDWDEKQHINEENFQSLKRKLGFPLSLQWSVLEEAFDELENLLKEQRKKKIQQQLVQSIQIEIKDFEDKWKQRLPEPWTNANTMFSQMHSLLDNLNEFLHKQAQYKEKVSELLEESQLWRVESQQIQKEIDHLLQLAKVKTEEKFRILGVQAKERKECIQRLSLVQQHLPLVEEEKETLTSSQIKEKIKTWDKNLQKREAELEITRAEIVKINYEIATLEEGEDYTALLHRYYEKKTEFQEYAIQWAQFAAAQKALAQTMASYKKERLPKVIKEANALVNELTNGQYIQIQRDDQQQLIIKRKDHVYFSPNQLSQATKEQVYVSIRLALVASLCREYPYPLLIDDGFVHFDAARTQSVLETLKQCSEKTQVIYFTCHDHIVEQFPKENILNLSALVKT